MPKINLELQFLILVEGSLVKIELCLSQICLPQHCIYNFNLNDLILIV